MSKHGLVDHAIEYAVETGNFDMAFKLARSSAKGKEAEVAMKYAMHLEDEGHFSRAEEYFIQAGKPREAIDMWLHAQDFDAAMRIAEQHDVASVRDVQVEEAKAMAARGDLAGAEQRFLLASEPERAVEAYQNANDYTNALRVAQQWLPQHKIR